MSTQTMPQTRTTCPACGHNEACISVAVFDELVGPFEMSSRDGFSYGTATCVVVESDAELRHASCAGCGLELWAD